MAVMEPVSLLPVRSIKRGIWAKTDGGKPCRAGGSPIASPISRCARAKRVDESIMKTTFFP